MDQEHLGSRVALVAGIEAGVKAVYCAVIVCNETRGRLMLRPLVYTGSTAVEGSSTLVRGSGTY